MKMAKITTSTSSANRQHPYNSQSSAPSSSTAASSILSANCCFSCKSARQIAPLEDSPLYVCNSCHKSMRTTEASDFAASHQDPTHYTAAAISKFFGVNSNNRTADSELKCKSGKVRARLFKWSSVRFMILKKYGSFDKFMTDHVAAGRIKSLSKQEPPTEAEFEIVGEDRRYLYLSDGTRTIGKRKMTFFDTLYVDRGLDSDQDDENLIN